MTETLTTLLEKASVAMGVAVDQVYSMLIQQAKVELVFDILLIIGMLLLIGFGVFAVKFCKKKADEEGYYSEWEAGVVVSSIMTAVAAGVTFIGIIPLAIKEIVQILINPPVWVIEYLIRMFS